LYHIFQKKIFPCEFFEAEHCPSTKSLFQSVNLSPYTYYAVDHSKALVPIDFSAGFMMHNSA
jgi:hypothetical protein